MADKGRPVISCMGPIPEGSKRARPQSCALTTDHVREYLEICEDQQLDEEIRYEAQRSGYCEEDAVQIVRRYRRQRRLKIHRRCSREEVTLVRSARESPGDVKAGPHPVLRTSLTRSRERDRG